MHRVLINKQGRVQPGQMSDLRGAQTTWVDMTNPTGDELAELERYTKIDATQIRAWLEGKKKATASDFQQYSVLTFLAPVETNSKRCSHIISTEPCVMMVSSDRNDFITIHRHPLLAILEIDQFPEKYKTEIFSQRATYLLFTLLNEIIEDYYTSLDRINETVQKAEAAALDPKPETNLMHQVLAVKKSIIFFHRALIANREVITVIEHEHLGFLDESILRQFRIISSSITQLVEITSTYRDILNTATEIHLTVISNSVNTTMKKVTSWGAVILIPSWIAGIFGMNFKHFAMFEWEYGVEISLAMMAASVGILYWFFKRRDWI